VPVAERVVDQVASDTRELPDHAIIRGRTVTANAERA
jgi:hypothetical protein